MADGDFGDADAAETFKGLVEAHGNQWPNGWTRGHGFVEPDTNPDDVPLLDWAHRYVDRLTGIDARTRKDYKRDIDNHFIDLPRTDADGTEHRLGGLVHALKDGTIAAPTVCNVTQDDVTDWVRGQEDGVRDPLAPEQ